MKTKNLYYHTVIKRTNSIKLLIFTLFLAICSWPRVFIETFTRRSFGERYYLFPLNILLAALLATIPFYTSFYDRSVFYVISTNLSWYAYLIIFVIYSIRRYKEVKREPGVYDFEKFSLSPGIIDSRFYSLTINGVPPTNRIIAIYLEPGVALIAGILLALLKQNIGYLLIICSIIYSISWAAQYYLGDQFIMNKIDEMICNEQLVESFVNNRMPGDTKGFEAYGRRPKDADFRRKVADDMMDEEPAADVF